MIDPQQNFGFQESNYERPNRDWECGWASQGEPCHIGPDGAGICQAHRECVPYKEGDRYQCARPPSFGGKCQLGPRPDGICAQRIVECQPVRTLRHRRKLFTYVVTVLAVGCCLVLIAGSWDKPLNSPGALTLQHHSAVQKCADCHTAAKSTFGDWVGSIAETGPMLNDSQKCLVCHEELKSNPLMAHGLDRKQLQEVSERVQSSEAPADRPLIYSLIDATSRHPLSDPKGLACALCHHEHRGRNFDLAQMSNIQCQSCHTSPFHSFGTDHPPFSGFPYKRRTRIYFNHVTHYQVHFKTFERVKPGAVIPEPLRNYGSAENPTAESCSACHQADSSGKTMPIRGFEHTCAACHGAEIEEDDLPGIELLAVPPVAETAFSETAPAIGAWPKLLGEDISKTTVMEVPPLMDLLLNGDKEYRDARQALNGANWSDLNDKQSAALQRVAWSIKRLIYELVTEGEKAGSQRLKYLDSLVGSKDEMAHRDLFSASLFHDPTFIGALKEAQQIWFPTLEDEFDQQKGGAIPPASATEISVPEGTREASSGWYADVGKGTIRYRVTGHADRLVRAILDLSARIPNLQDESQTLDTPLPEVLARGSLSSLFDVLGDPTAPQRCIGCHTTDKQKDDDRLVINWVGRHVSPKSQSFNRFSHAPHLRLLTRDTQSTSNTEAAKKDSKIEISPIFKKGDCKTCHWPDKTIHFTDDNFIRTDDNYSANTDPHSQMTSGFLPITKATCAKCHQENLAGDSCLKCHNYHIFK